VEGLQDGRELKHMTCKGRLRELVLSSSESRQLRATHQHPSDTHREDGGHLFTEMCGGKTTEDMVG